MGWTGDISKLGNLAKNIARLGTVPARASVRVAAEIKADILSAWDAGMSPYFQKWEPHKEETIRRHGSHPLLELSGAMRSSLDVRPMGATGGVSITIDDPAPFHQGGTKNMAARPMLPFGTMPAGWKESIRSAVEDTIRETVAG